MSYSFERLEDRSLLAATAFISKTGILNIVGTESVDTILVTGTGLGTFNVRIDVNGDGDVIDALDSNQNFLNVRGIKVTLKGGNDTFVLADPHISGDVYINGGKGNDTIAVGDLNTGTDIFGNLTIIGGANDDIVVLESDVRGNVSINTGSGNDNVRAGVDTFVSIDGRVKVNLGGGNDRIRVDDVTVGIGAAVINGGGGSDQFLTWYEQSDVQLAINNGKLKLSSFENFAFHQRP